MTTFAGVAEDYQRYRVPYPNEVFDWIVREYALDGQGRLLDVGCGTGYVCLALSPWFEDVVAVDPEPDMLRVAVRAAHERRLNNVRFLCQRAEDVPSTVAPLRLVTFGNSFHWTDRTKVANALFPLIAPGGGIVAIASSSIWAGHRAVESGATRDDRCMARARSKAEGCRGQVGGRAASPGRPS